MGRRRSGPEWGKDALRDIGFSNIVQHRLRIVDGIGEENVDVYLFLTEQFARGSVTDNRLFQFVYRSFYMLDAAKSLTQNFKKKYFELMEAARGKVVDVRTIARTLFEIPNAKDQENLQFSFVTKLAHTVDYGNALYDSNVANYFGFRAPYSKSSGFDSRIKPLMDFYCDLAVCYKRILADGLLEDVMQLFRETYSAGVPEIKILDFIFYSAGRLRLSVEFPSTVTTTKAVIASPMDANC
jgi:hypothetical protein